MRDVQVHSGIKKIASNRLDVDIAAIVLGKQAAISNAAKKIQVLFLDWHVLVSHSL